MGDPYSLSRRNVRIKRQGVRAVGSSVTCADLTRAYVFNGVDDATPPPMDSATGIVQFR
jgi:hypothetical protein